MHTVIAGVRVFALFLVIGAAQAGLMLLTAPNWGGAGMLLATVWVTTVGVPVALAVVLWVYPQLLLAGVSANQSEPKQATEAMQWQVIGFNLIGIWLLLTGLRDLVQHGAMYLAIVDSSSAQAPSLLYQFQLWGALAQTVLAISLILGARGLLGLLRKIRAFGAQPSGRL